MSEDGSKALTETPVYDQQFFIQLALKGNDVWNAWRRDPANKDICVNFSNIDFSAPPQNQINFSGFEFGDRADFWNCSWSDAPQDNDNPTLGTAIFEGALFGQNVNFRGSIFGNRSSFKNATFGKVFTPTTSYDDQPKFDGTMFGYSSSFENAKFNYGASFKFARFGYQNSFKNARFGIDSGSGLTDFAHSDLGLETDFSNAEFGFAIFRGAVINGNPSFKNTKFYWRATFQGTSKDSRENELEWIRSTISDSRYKALCETHEKINYFLETERNSVYEISYENACFYKETNFSGRSFLETANFRNSEFFQPPNFDETKHHHRIDLTGATVSFKNTTKLPLFNKWTTNSEISLYLRALRKIAEDTKNHDLERDLYIEERKAERGVYYRQYWEKLKAGAKALNLLRTLNATTKLMTHTLWVGVMALYWAVADYGRSFVRPCIAFALSIPFFQRAYHHVFDEKLNEAVMIGDLKGESVEAYRHAIDMVGLGNAVPFVGPLTIDADIKKFLFCGKIGEALKNCAPVPPESYQWLVLTQNLVSITLVFFIGLALRNYFKIK